MLFLAVESIIGASSLGDVREPVFAVVGLILVVAATIVASRPGPYPMPRAPAIAVVAATVTTAGLIAWQLPTDRPPGYAAWWVGASSFLFLLLALRGRAGWAWVGMSAVSIIVLGWSVSAGPGLVTGVNLAARNSATLLVGTLFAVGIARTAARITEFSRTERTNLSRTAAAEASLAERRSHVRRLRATTGELLRRIAEGTGLTETERRECLVVEGALRDEARAPNLAVEPLVTRVRELRRSGTHVVLLDERGQRGLPDADRARLIAWLVQGLESVEAGGQVTARIPPGGRGILATVVVDQGGHSLTRSLEG